MSSDQFATVDLSWCRELTDKAVISIAEHCPNLTSLNLYSCRKLTNNAKKQVYKMFPNMAMYGLR